MDGSLERVEKSERNKKIGKIKIMALRRRNSTAARGEKQN